jgi:two-component system C4-dicarboxylate transport sensor histidine kinase DctB
MIDPTLPPLVGSSLLDDAADSDFNELQRFAELGRLSASLIHEISAPLAATILCLDQTDFGQFPHLRHVRRNIRLLHRYVEAARQQVHQKSTATSFGIAPRLAQIKRIAEPVAKQAQVHLHITNTYMSRMHGDPVKFQQIITNLLLNAIHAYGSTSPGQPRRHVYVSLSGSQRHLRISVQDFGVGISPQALPHIFKPFYTTKSNKGMGLGLALVEKYVREDFQGTITVSSSPAQGTQFVVKLRNRHKQ